MMRKTPLKRKSTKPTKTLRRKAWKTFADWVKARDKYTCVTCGKRMSKGDPNCQAGHLVHGDSLDFDERNLSCQCSRCNKFLHGNGVPYAVYVAHKYGIDTIHELQRLKREPRKFTRDELEDIIRRYGNGI